MAGLASHKSASGLGLVAFGTSQSTPRLVPLAPNPGDADDIICSFINIFLVVFHDMHNELDFTEVISMRRRRHASYREDP